MKADIENKVFFQPFQNIIQQNIFYSEIIPNGAQVRTISSIPADKQFIVADVYISSRTINDYFSVTFSREATTSCSLVNTSGGGPASDFNGRTQTTSIMFNADQYSNSYGWPRYGQFT